MCDDTRMDVWGHGECKWDWLCGVQAGGDVGQRIVWHVEVTLRTSDTFDACLLFQAQPFEPGVVSPSFHELAVILRWRPETLNVSKAHVTVDPAAHVRGRASVKERGRRGCRMSPPNIYGVRCCAGEHQRSVWECGWRS